MAAANAVQPKARRKPCNAGKGRIKGTPNKTTAALKDAILNAFNKVGGEDYLVMLAEKDPKTFAMLLAKVLPLQISGDPDQPVRVEVTWAE
jgi:hypothetical protein